MQFWNELEGQIFDSYPLLRLVRSEGRTAWFETEIREGQAQPATISLTESLTDADEVIARLEEAQSIHNPNLATIHKVGQGRLDRTFYIYALMEHADQNLGEVLKGQALSATEGRQLAEAMVGALREIHSRGLVHGRVEPDSILAVGESIKLRSDCLQSPGGTRAGDVAGIGATLFEAFTQQRASAADDAQINRIPAPFAEIIRNSLNSRWSLGQIASVLRIPATAASPAPAPSAERPADPVTPPVTPVKAAAPSAVPPTSAPTPPSKRPPAPPSQEEAPATPMQPLLSEKSIVKSRPTMLYAALAVIFLLLLLWLLLRSKPHEAPSPAPPIAKPAAAGSSSPSTPALPPKPDNRPSAVEKPPAVRSASHEVSEVPASPGIGGARTVWRVVVYTYYRKDQAQHKADDINQAHHDLQATVFAPSGSSYLVVLGGAMDRQQAFAERDKARSEGLPRDTYAQNYSK